MSYRKNVFVIGAGASAHRGAPLMGNFVGTAREILDRGALLPADANRFRNVIEYWIAHDLTEKAAKLKLANLEDLFGLVDLNVRVNPSVASVRRDMVFMILRTLEERITREVKTECSFYFRFDSGQRKGARQASIMRQFVDIVSRRWDASPDSGVVQDSIISTNYDELVEEVLTLGGLKADYGLAEPDSSKKGQVTLKLLKLHGSVNWSICTACHHVKVHPLGTKIATIERSPCEACGGQVEPFIVPPTWSKGERRAPLESVWKTAFDELLQARRWVFIGTSLPEADRYLRYFFGLALQHNSQLDRIVVINQNECGYDDLFEHHASRISLDHPRIQFEQAIQDATLQDKLGQVPYAQENPLW
jgi:NAD-dependent SIR2 family protein deacetylase